MWSCTGLLTRNVLIDCRKNTGVPVPHVIILSTPATELVRIAVDLDKLLCRKSRHAAHVRLIRHAVII